MNPRRARNILWAKRTAGLRAMTRADGLACLLLLGGSSQAQAPEWSKFELARERLGHKVIVDAVLANPQGPELSDVRILAVFYSGQSELRRTTAVRIPRIAPGHSAPVRLEAEQVPNFDRYEAIVETGGRKFVYTPADPGRPPVLRKASQPRLAVVSYKDYPPQEFPGRARLEIVVKNLSEADAQDPVALLSFLDAAGVVVHKTYVRLAPSIRGLSEDSFEIAVPKVPEYAAAAAAAAWTAAEIPPPAEPPPDAAEVAIRGLRIRRLSDGTALVTGSVRNGTAGAVEKVRIDLRLGTKAHSVSLPGQIAPGASLPFEAFVPACPPFEDGAYSISHKEASRARQETAPEPAASAKRTGSRDVSAEAAFVPEKDAQDLKPKTDGPTQAKGPALTAEIRGVRWIEGLNLRGLKTGDVAYLRMAFRDADGNPAQPTGSFTAITYDGDRPLKNVPRNITKDSWKLDARRINAQNANHETVARDPATGELWVGLLRTETGSYMNLRLDVKLTVPKIGTWTWKGLEDKCEAPARGPDEKK